MTTLADRSLFEHWPKALIAVNEKNQIEEANHLACKILGWSKQELVGMNLHDSLCSHALGYLHSDEDCPLIKPSFYVNDNYKEYRWKVKSGDLIAIYAKGIVLHPNQQRLIAFSDESDTNYSQNDMQRLASFAEHSPSPIVEFDSQGGIGFTNPAMVELLSEIGFDENGFPLVIPADINEIINNTIKNNQPQLGVEKEIEGRYFLWDFYPIPSSDSPIIQCYGRETTAAKLLTDSLRREKEAAEAANKSKSHFLSVMSHELRTPMNSIIGFSRRLLNRAQKDLPDLYVNALQTIFENAQNLMLMINETLDLSKIEAGKMEPVITEFKPLDIAEEIVRLLKVQAEEKGLCLNLHIDPELPISIQSDRDFLRKILINLIGNAIKFTDNGDIDFAIRGVSEDEILIAIRDDGIGISQDEQTTIFEKFTQASGEDSRRHIGTGLGLTLCRELTNLLKGEIGVESELGEGSTFWVQIPINLPLSDSQQLTDEL